METNWAGAQPESVVLSDRRMISKTSTKRLALAVAALGLTLGIAGCGSTAATNPTPKASPSASAKTSPQAKGLTLAKASSPGYKFSYPLVSCSTLSAAAQAAWAPLLAGSRISECAPADFIQKYVPQVLTVDDQDPAISQKQANAYGRALMVTFGWSNLAAVDDAPALTMAVGQGAGPDASYYQMLVSGGVVSANSIGSSAWPQSITLITLSSANQAIMANTTDKFALVVSYVQHGYSFTVTYPGQAPKMYSPGPRTPAVYTGALATSPVLGNYFLVNTFTDNCSTGPAAGICQAVGIS